MANYTVTINFDSHIQSVFTPIRNSDDLVYSWTQSGSSVVMTSSASSVYGGFKCNTANGYILDSVTSSAGGTIYRNTDDISFSLTISRNTTITITSKASPKGYRSYDLASSTKWESLLAGEHTVYIAAKDTDVKSTILTFTKPKMQYVIDNVLTSVTADTNNATTIEEGSTATLKYTANTGYKLPDTITVSGATYTWNSTTGIVTLSNPTANISITITGVADTVMISGKYAFANTLTAPASAMSEDVTFSASLSGFAGQCTNISLMPSTGVMNFTKSTGDTVLVYNFTTKAWADYTSRVIDFGTVEQAVSSAFYKWAITDGNLSASIIEPDTYVLADTPDMTTFPATTLIPLDFTADNVNFNTFEFYNGSYINYMTSSNQTVQAYDNTTKLWSTAYKTIVVNRRSGVPTKFKTWLENNLQPAGAHKVTFASNFTYENGSGYSSSAAITSDTGESALLSASSTRGTVWENVTTLTISGNGESSSANVYYTMNGVSGTWDCMSDETLSLTGDITIDSAYFICLTGDTLITMHDGSQKQIKDIVAGEKVLSYNPETMLLESDTVTYSDSNLNKSYCRYIIYTLSDGTEIKTVHRHRFYNVEKQAMVYMDKWNIGEHFIKIDGTTPYLVSSRIVEEEVNHYTIFTEHQNYFANGMLSGNRHTKQMNLK